MKDYRMKKLSNSTVLVVAFLAALGANVFSAEPAAKTETSEKGIRGYKGLFMGHSFFWPSAHQLKRIIPDTNVVGHEQAIVSSGGAGGSPGRLWENERKRIEGQRILDSKKIDLLVMTYHSPANSSAEHYSRWFDYALSQNPKTTFMVAVSWGTHLCRADQKRLDYLKTGGQRIQDAVIAKLRAKYPDNVILFCPYGFGTYELIDRLNSGELPGVKHILNMDREARRLSKKNKEQLLNDELGHPGELVTTVATLMWLQTLYDYDLSTLKTKELVGLPGIDCAEIAATACKKVKPFNAIYNR